jgi:lipopolysaccharide export system protein LptC
MERRTLLFGGLLLAVLGGSKWLAEFLEVEETALQPESHTADYFLDNFTNTVMGPDGKPFRRLSADQMLHFPDDDSTELTKPKVTLFEEKDIPPWKIRSEQGWLSGDGNLLLLKGTVTIDREQAPGIRPIHIVTRNLRVQPGENYAETDEVITVTSLGSRLKSKGMQAWFNKPVRIKFLTDVRGYYETNF